MFWAYPNPQGIFQRPSRHGQWWRGSSACDLFEEEPCLRVLTMKRVVTFKPEIYLARDCEAKEEQKALFGGF